MKQSARSLRGGMAVAFFFLLMLVTRAEEKAPAPPPPAVESTPPPAAAPATNAAPAAPDTPAQPASVPAPDTTPAPLRRLDEPGVEVEKARESTPPPGRARSRTGRTPATNEQIEAARRRAAERAALHTGGEVVNVFGDSHLPAGEKTDFVVAVFGEVVSEGEVIENVVAVFGDSRVTGHVHGNTVTVFGDSTINSAVDGNIVVVFGDLQLGPEARIGGFVTCVAGTITRDPGAVVRVGWINNPISTKLPGLKAWFEECFLKGRPLAFNPRLGWAWGIAFSFLVCYVLGALLFRSGAEKCLKTLETNPGYSILTALLALLIAPVLAIVLGVTVVGIPFIFLGMLCATLFGKMVVLGWIGRRFTRYLGDGPLGHIAFAVLVGGLLVMLLYTIPVVGVLVFKFTGWIGMGAVLYTLMQGMKREKAAANGVKPRPAPAAAPASAPVTAPMSEARAPDAVPVMPSDVPLTSSGFVGAAAMPGVPEPAMGAIPGEPGFAPIPPFAERSGAVPPPPLRPAFPTPLPSAPVISASTLPRAGFWLRLAAMAIDGLIIGFLVGGFLNGGPVMFPALAAYAAIMWKFKSTTIGGVICSLKVVRIDDRPLDWPTSIVRALGCFLSMAAMGFGFIWVAFDRDKQSWHDKIAGTTVVIMPKGVSLL